MKANIIQIGNSKGIILPSEWLRKLNLSLKSVVRISMEDEKIVIQSDPRQGWADAFKEYALAGEEETFFPDVFNDEDLDDLTWEQK